MSGVTTPNVVKWTKLCKLFFEIVVIQTKSPPFCKHSNVAISKILNPSLNGELVGRIINTQRKKERLCNLCLSFNSGIRIIDT